MPESVIKAELYEQTNKLWPMTKSWWFYFSMFICWHHIKCQRGLVDGASTQGSAPLIHCLSQYNVTLTFMPEVTHKKVAHS